eukprot:scaffold6066_cov161-Amphora_coffeaeformis.AAC.4
MSGSHRQRIGHDTIRYTCDGSGHVESQMIELLDGKKMSTQKRIEDSSKHFRVLGREFSQVPGSLARLAAPIIVSHT